MSNLLCERFREDLAHDRDSANGVGKRYYPRIKFAYRQAQQNAQVDAVVQGVLNLVRPACEKAAARVSEASGRALAEKAARDDANARAAALAAQLERSQAENVALLAELADVRSRAATAAEISAATERERAAESAVRDERLEAEKAESERALADKVTSLQHMLADEANVRAQLDAATAESAAAERARAAELAAQLEAQLERVQAENAELARTLAYANADLDKLRNLSSVELRSDCDWREAGAAEIAATERRSTEDRLAEQAGTIAQLEAELELERRVADIPTANAAAPPPAYDGRAQMRIVADLARATKHLGAALVALQGHRMPIHHGEAADAAGRSARRRKARRAKAKVPQHAAAATPDVRPGPGGGVAVPAARKRSAAGGAGARARRTERRRAAREPAASDHAPPQ